MSNKNHDFPKRAAQVSLLMQYLAEHRHAISGPRTLKNAYTTFRCQLMAGSISLTDLQRERVRRLDPNKVNWPDAYEWWHAYRDAAP